MKTVLQPAGWPRPRGYANGVAAHGPHGVRRRHDRLGRRSAASTATTSPTRCARRCRTSSPCWPRPAREPEHIVRMTWYVTDKRDYVAALPRDRRGLPRGDRQLRRRDDARSRSSALIEDRAKVEIEVTAVIPE